MKKNSSLIRHHKKLIEQPMPCDHLFPYTGSQQDFEVVGEISLEADAVEKYRCEGFRNIEILDNEVVFHTGTEQSHIFVDTDIVAKEVDVIAIRLHGDALKSESPNSQAFLPIIYFSTDDDGDEPLFIEKRKLWVHYNDFLESQTDRKESSGWVTLEMFTGWQKRWQGRIRKLRIDLAKLDNHTIRVRSIQFLRSKDTWSRKTEEISWGDRLVAVKQEIDTNKDQRICVPVFTGQRCSGAVDHQDSSTFACWYGWGGIEEKVGDSTVTLCLEAVDIVTGDLLEQKEERISAFEGWRRLQLDISAFPDQLILQASLKGDALEVPLLLHAPWVLGGTDTDLPPLVLFISIDACRYDRTSFAGLNTTPAMKALSKDAVVFHQAYSTSTWTKPSHTGIFTGRYPWKLGVYHRHDSFPQDTTHIAGELYKRGYRTAAATGGGFIGTFVGFDSCVERFIENDSYNSKAMVDSLIDLLNESSDTPMYMFGHTFDVHHFLDTNTETDPVGTPIPENVGRFNKDVNENFRRVIAVNGGSAEPLTEDEQKLVDLLYNKHVSQADAQLERLVGELKKRDLYDQALIAVFADHGELLGEEGKYYHGITVREEVTHVPLIIKFPGAEFAGTDIREPVSLADLVPTVFDYLGLDVDQNQMDGVSLLPALAEGKQISHDVIVGEYDFNPFTSIRRETFKIEFPHLHRTITYGMVDPKEGFQAVDLEGEHLERARSMWASALDNICAIPGYLYLIADGWCEHPIQVIIHARHGFQEKRLQRYLFQEDKLMGRGTGLERDIWMQLDLSKGFPKGLALLPILESDTITVTVKKNLAMAPHSHLVLGNGETSATTLPYRFSLNTSPEVYGNVAGMPQFGIQEDWRVRCWYVPVDNEILGYSDEEKKAVMQRLKDLGYM